MLPQGSVQARRPERVSWPYAPPRTTPNSSKLVRTGLPITAPQFSWIAPRTAKSFCGLAVEHSSPMLRINMYNLSFVEPPNTTLSQERDDDPSEKPEHAAGAYFVYDFDRSR